MITTFEDDDAGYLGWLSTHPAGHVLNTGRSPAANYLILHRAACRTISGRPARGDRWTGQYIKVCSDEEPELEDWARRATGGTPQRCGLCG